MFIYLKVNLCFKKLELNYQNLRFIGQLYTSYKIYIMCARTMLFHCFKSNALLVGYPD